jgi:hypothetical protein
MKTLRFNAEPHHVFLEGDEAIHGGQTFDVADHRAAELLAVPANNVTPALPANPKRAEVDEFLVNAGLDPKDYPNINAAVAALESPPEVSADEGQGNSTDEETPQ